MKQSNGLKRDILDKFYTSPDIVEKCYAIIVEMLNINYYDDLIIEPSAGNGAFFEIIKKLSSNYKLYDICPDKDIIEKQDYLHLNIDSFQSVYNKIHVIGNPPFGRQSSLAVQFIKKSATYCDSISFILPKSFRKDSLKDKVPLNFHCIYEEDLPNNSFLLNDTEYNVPCIFQIWERRKTNRDKLPILVEKGFKFVKKDEVPDISFRRVGVNAGTISYEIENKSIQSHYFIKFDDFNKIVYDSISSLTFSNSGNTVGPKSISKQELIREFNPIFKD